MKILPPGSRSSFGKLNVRPKPKSREPRTKSGPDNDTKDWTGVGRLAAKLKVKGAHPRIK